jgi:lipopolysaccharide/colanic/teichoic acid biosynthesis glycosyltransferase
MRVLRAARHAHSRQHLIRVGTRRCSRSFVASTQQGSIIAERGAIVVEQSSQLATASKPDAGRAGPIDRAAKRVLDIGLCLSALVLLGPVLLTIGLLVKIDSPGPAFYRRRVLGRGGGQFDAFKLRTMRTDGEQILDRHPELRAQLAQDHKLENDPRVTKLGAFLRKTSIDELPQLVNVLRGEMSLIGPRMISPPELTRYGAHADELLSVRPGISGLWQVSGRSSLAPDDRVRLDLRYIRTRTVWGDIVLIARTIPAVLKSRGAY